MTKIFYGLPIWLVQTGPVNIEVVRFFSNFSTKPHILYEGAIFLRKFNIKN